MCGMFTRKELTKKSVCRWPWSDQTTRGHAHAFVSPSLLILQNARTVTVNIPMDCMCWSIFSEWGRNRLDCWTFVFWAVGAGTSNTAQRRGYFSLSPVFSARPRNHPHVHRDFTFIYSLDFLPMPLRCLLFCRLLPVFPVPCLHVPAVLVATVVAFGAGRLGRGGFSAAQGRPSFGG